jgi:hypothetical protein
MAGILPGIAALYSRQRDQNHVRPAFRWGHPLSPCLSVQFETDSAATAVADRRVWGSTFVEIVRGNLSTLP